MITLLLACFAAAPLVADGDGAAAWFHDDPLAPPYVSVESDIRGLFDQFGGAGIPPEPLMDKLKEGASKGVPPEALLGALRAEAGRLRAAQDMLSRQQLRASGGERVEMLRAVSLLLLAGLRAPTVESLLASASTRGREASDLIAALHLMVQVKLSTRLTDMVLGTLGAALLRSGLPRAAFPSIPEVLRNADARGVDVEVAARTMVGVLDAGGGILQMEEAIRTTAAAAAGSAGSGKGTPAAAGSPPEAARTGTQSTPAGTARGPGASGGASPAGQGSEAGDPNHRKGQ